MASILDDLDFIRKRMKEVSAEKFGYKSTLRNKGRDKLCPKCNSELVLCDDFLYCLGCDYRFRYRKGSK